VEKLEEAGKNKGIARINDQKCKVYKTFNIIIIVLENGTKSDPRSAIRCYQCWGDVCRDPFTGRPEHEVNCRQGLDFCAKIAIFNGKWLHNRHLNIYITQSHKISQNM